MYLKSIKVRNLKCFTELGLDFSSDLEPSGIRRWTALLGENGVGKSTLLQAIGTALAGPEAVSQLLQFPDKWVRAGESHSEIRAELLWSEGDEPPVTKTRDPFAAWFAIASESASMQDINSEKMPADPQGRSFTVHPDDQAQKDFALLRQTAYSEKARGWLACGYGPFRRLSGGGGISSSITASGRRSARLVTLFYEEAALTDVETWLKELHNTAREGDKDNQRRLDLVKQAFRERLLPFPAELQVDARRARLKVGDRQSVEFDELSDGYRSMLALSIDLIRWLTVAFPGADEPMRCPGIVLVDELDTHLHPKWQRQIGFWLLEKFPKLQFIVATHSPFLAQVASEQSGNTVLEAIPGEGVRARSDLEAVDTWRTDQILYELFDMDSSRSPRVEQEIEEFQDLHLKYRKGQLSKKDESRYQRLREWVESLPVIQDPEERRLAEQYRQAVARYAADIEKRLR